ncbi:MAG: hypothetical protein OZ948_16060 [Deltaproteobacteria bacterium]|nr:hypothetical protein [Deltaproteobacteria bacterium]
MRARPASTVPQACSGRAVLLAAACALLGALPARAALVPVALEVEVVAVDPGVTGITVGDRYALAFTIDDQVTDTDDSLGAGHFPGLVTAFSAVADPGNAGAWSPDAGVFSMAGSNFVTNAYGENLTLQIRGTGFPAAGFPFYDFDLRFAWLPGISDSGLGDPFSTQLGVAPGTLDLAGAPFYGSVRFTDGYDYFVATIAVPEPARAAAGCAQLLALVLVAAVRRRGCAGRRAAG